MALDIATATAEAPGQAAVAAPRRRRRGISPLTRRILAINVLALALLGGGLLYLGVYRQNLIDAQLAALKTQGEIFAAALGEGAVMDSPDYREAIIPDRARDMMLRLVEPTQTRARLFDDKRQLLGDTRVLGGASQAIEIDQLSAPDQGNLVTRMVRGLYARAMAWIPSGGDYTPYVESANAADYPEVQRAYQGDIATAVHLAPSGHGLIMTAAVPVQHYKEVLGVVLLSAGSSDIEQAEQAVRLSIARLFLVALAVTVLLSVYLAGTIVRPVRRLAAAAERVRRGQGRQLAIPDFSARGDEIGDLSNALREMTSALWQRMDAIEHFAADVAHEIKNPLTSLRSAVETAALVADPEKQRRLLAVVIEDVKRLDRLITDISAASRLDAELSRDESSTVKLGPMLAGLVDLYREMAGSDAPEFILDLANAPSAPPPDLAVTGVEGRLVEVFRNLLDNALSFSSPGGTIAVRARRIGACVRIEVEDEGPGIPEGKLTAIFDRFYSERPPGEAFGTHSGLGLAIAKQIVAAHHGSIRAENRSDKGGTKRGARFIVELPAETSAG